MMAANDLQLISESIKSQIKLVIKSQIKLVINSDLKHTQKSQNGSRVRSRHLLRMRWALALGSLPLDPWHTCLIKCSRRTPYPFYNSRFCFESDLIQTYTYIFI